MTRRAPGTGSVQHLGGDRYYLRWRERGQREGRVVRGTEEHAHDVLAAVLADVAAEGSAGGVYTVADICEAWLDRQERRGYTGARAQRNRYDNHVATQPWADWPADDLRSSHVRRWLDTLERRLSPSSVRHCAYLVSAAYRDALERELVAANPVAAVRKPSAGSSRRNVVLSAEQHQALAELDGGDAARTIALALAGTGLRPGELLGLRLDETHDDHLRIERSGRTTDATKTGHRRRVELFGWGRWAVRRWLKVIRPTLKVRGRVPKREPWTFPVPAGWLRTDHRLGAALAAVGAGELHAHDLRGTCATHLLSGTWGEPWTIAEVAAHLGDSIQTTERSYAHLVGGAARRAARGIRLGYAASGVALDSTVIPLVGHEGLEPSANGLRVLRGVERSRKDELSGVPPVSHLARRVLDMAAEGDPRALSVALDLAAAVLDAEDEDDSSEATG